MSGQIGFTRRDFLRAGLAGGAGCVVGASAFRAAAAAAAPGAFRVGIYTRPWDRHDVRVALDAIAEAGFKYAGLMTTATGGRKLVVTADLDLDECARIAGEIRSRGLSVPSVYASALPVAQSLEAGIEALRRLIDNCTAVGARTLLMGGTSKPDLVDAYYKAIAECCDYAAAKNLAITVKPHGGMNATGPQCRQYIEKVGHRNFSLWYDPGNIFTYSDGALNPVDDAATVDGLVREGMCIKDFTMATVEGKVEKSVWITPGTGKVDFPAVLARLKRGGFAGGDLVVECVTRPDPDDLRAILAEAKKARAFVEGLI